MELAMEAVRGTLWIAFIDYIHMLHMLKLVCFNIENST